MERKTAGPAFVLSKRAFTKLVEKRYEGLAMPFAVLLQGSHLLDQTEFLEYRFRWHDVQPHQFVRPFQVASVFPIERRWDSPSARIRACRVFSSSVAA
jgi:hypothetical protein